MGYLYFGYDWEQSRLWLTAAVQAFEGLQLPPHSSLRVLSMLEFCTGNLSAARALNQKRLDLARQEGAEEQRMLANIELAGVCYFEGNVEQAEALAEILLHCGWPIWKGDILVQLGGSGAHAHAREFYGQPMEPIYIPAYERLVVNMRDMLNEDVYQAMWADGYSMPLEDAMRYAQHMDEE